MNVQIQLSDKVRLQPRGISVLVVEDELSLQTIVGRVFRQLDPRIEMTWVKSAEAALQLVSRRHFDLVLCDYFLSGRLSGLSVWRYCSRHMPRVPVVMMSSLSVPTYLDLVKDLPVKPAFLHKPFSVSECRNVLFSHMTF